MIRRFLAMLSLSLLLVVPAVNLVAAPSAGAVDVFHNICSGQNDTGTNANGTDVCGESGKGGNPAVNAIRVAILMLSFVIGAAAVIVIILSAFKMIRAGGNPQEISTARMGIIYAAIGLAIAVTAPIIVGFVLHNLG